MVGGWGTKLGGGQGEVLELQFLHEEKKSLKDLSETGAIAQPVKCLSFL